MNGTFQLANDILKKYSQEHLLSFYNDVNENQKKMLLEQILRIDFEKIQTLYENSFIDDLTDEKIISPLPHFNKAKLTDEEKENFKQIGINSIKKGECAVVTLSGGQRHKTWTLWS